MKKDNCRTTRRSGSGRHSCGGRFSQGYGGDNMGNSRDYREYSGDGEYHYDSYTQGNFFSGPFYRARGGKLMGVCLGLSRRFDVRVTLVRLAFIFLAISTGFMPALVLYAVLGVLMKPEPVIRPYSYDERNFYSSYVSSRKEAVSKLKEKFDRVDKRIRDMESVVTSKEYDWDRRFSQKG